MPRFRRSVIVAAALAICLVGIGIWMIIAGWPLQTPEQTAMMDLAQLPMSAAVLVAIVEMTWQRRLWRRRPVTRFAAVYGPGAALVLAGAVMFVVAFALPRRTWVGPAQLMIWTGLGIAFLYLAVDSVRREFRDPGRHLEPLDDDFDDLWDDGETDDDPADADLPAYGSFQAPRLIEPDSTPADSKGGSASLQ